MIHEFSKSWTGLTAKHSTLAKVDSRPNSESKAELHLLIEVTEKHIAKGLDIYTRGRSGVCDLAVSFPYLQADKGACYCFVDSVRDMRVLGHKG